MEDKFFLIYTAPFPPKNVVSGSVGVTWISISWDSPSMDGNIVGYIVTAATEGGNVSVTVSGSETEVNVTGLQPATVYTLTVVSVSDHEEISAPSVSVIVTTLARLGTHTLIHIISNVLSNPFSHTAPLPPENIVSESIGVTWMTISWDNPSIEVNIINYIVTVASKGANISVTVSGSETEVNVTGLQPASEYTLTVVSVSDDGQISSPSVPLIVMTLARPGTNKLHI